MDIIRPLSKQPIPKNAKKVFSGILFDVYQWEQELYDGTKKTFEKVKRQDTVGVIPITTDHKILVTHQEQPGTEPFIGLPGGIIDENEDPLTAIKRELIEETGYDSSLWSLYTANQPFSKVDWALYIFIARECKKTIDPHLDSGEKMEIEIVSWEDFLQIIVGEKFRDHELCLHFLKQLHKENGDELLHQQILGF